MGVDRGPGFHWGALAMEDVGDCFAESLLVAQVADVAVVGPDSLTGIGEAGGAEGSGAGGFEFSENPAGVLCGVYDEMDVGVADVQGVELPVSRLAVAADDGEEELAAGWAQVEGWAFRLGGAPAVEGFASGGGGVEGVAAPSE